LKYQDYLLFYIYGLIHDYVDLLGRFAVGHGFALDAEFDDFVI